MENIRQAIERAKGSVPEQHNGFQSELLRTPAGSIEHSRSKQKPQEIELDPSRLQSHRIVAYDGQDPRSRSFDFLRTEVLRSMDLNDWKVLAVTSPTPGCGKTLMAVNLSLSIGRQPERQVRLVDLDLRKPQVAASLGLSCRGGVLDVLEGREQIENSIIQARVGGSRLEVLPTGASPASSDLVASTAMKVFLQDVAGTGKSRIVIFDLPPLLTGHDVISILPRVDCVLLVAAVGVSKISDLKECYTYLRDTDVVRFVLNKVPQSSITTYAYY